MQLRSWTIMDRYIVLQPEIIVAVVACSCTCHLQVLNGALLIPAGVYRITKTLDTRKSIVLRGAGKGLTTLYFPFSLTEVYGNTWSEVGPTLGAYLLVPGRPEV